MPLYNDEQQALFVEDRHIIQLSDKSWTILHPFQERFSGNPLDLLNCPLTAIWEDNDDPLVRGRFFLNTDGSLGNPVPDPVPGIDSI